MNDDEGKPEFTPLEKIQAEQIISQQTRINELEKQRQDVLTELSNYILELVSIRSWEKILIMNVVDNVMRIYKNAYGTPPEYNLKINANCVETVVNDPTRGEVREDDKIEKPIKTKGRICKYCAFFKFLNVNEKGYCHKKRSTVYENTIACEEWV